MLGKCYYNTMVVKDRSMRTIECMTFRMDTINFERTIVSMRASLALNAPLPISNNSTSAVSVMRTTFSLPYCIIPPDERSELL